MSHLASGFGRAQTQLNSSRYSYTRVLYHYCTTTVRLLYCYCNTTVQPLYYYRQTTVLLYCCTAVLLYYCTTVLLHYCTTMYYCTIVLWYYCTIVLLYYCTIVLLYYCTIVLSYYYCTTTVLLLYYCTTVLHAAAPHQASDVVDCGGGCRLEAKAFKMKGFQFWQLPWSDRGLAWSFWSSPNLARQLQVPLLHYYCATIVLQYYYCTILLLLYYHCTTMVLLLYYCTTVLLLHYYCTITCAATVLHTTAPYQASDVVDCGGECRLEAKGKVFSFGSFLGVTVAWLRLLVVPKPR